jgi:prepilin-type N-terminal cleavage/methylation domain-containing protein
MKSQKGFTLIELLLVLAIIGIISSIAIPALLGQRSRARDKSGQQNAVGVVGDIIAQYDKAKESGLAVDTAANFITNVYGTTAATTKVPSLFGAKNPWNTAGALTAYAAAPVTETTTSGVTTMAAASVGVMGQVQVGYLPATATVPGVIVTAVYLQNSFLDATNTSTHVFVKLSNLE